MQRWILTIIFSISLGLGNQLHAVREEPKGDTTAPYAFINASAGITLNLHLASFQQLPGIPSCCPGYRGGYGIGSHLSVGYELHTLPAGPWNVGLLFSTAGATLIRQESIGNTLFVQDNDTLTIPVDVEYRLESSLWAIGVDISKIFPLSSRFELMAGVELWYFWNQSFNQQEQILRPANVTFTDGRRIRNDYQGPIPQFRAFHPVATVGLRWHLPTGLFATLSPFVLYRISPLPLSTVSWRYSQLVAGATLRFPLRTAPPPPIQRDTLYHRDTTTIFIVGLARDTIQLVSRSSRFYREFSDELRRIVLIITEHYEHRRPKKPELTASLQIVDIQNQQALPVDTIHIIEQEIFETLPLLPFVFFAPGDSLLQTARLHLLAPGEVDQFDPSTLPPDPLVLYREILNIIGFRLRQYPTATLTITGCNNGDGIEQGNLALSKARAQAVYHYLTTVWKIDSSRFRLRWQHLPDKPTNPGTVEGQEENARAELRSSDHRVLAPLRLRQRRYRAVPPTLYIIPQVSIPHQLRWWQLRLQSDRIVRLNTAAQDSAPDTIQWTVPASELIHHSEITINFEAYDRYDQQTTATATLPIILTTYQQRRAIVEEDKTVEIFSLILFDFDSAELTDAHHRILKEVRAHITPRSTVKIYGYTDRTGSKHYNRQLATQRCENVAKALRPWVHPDRLFIYPIGSDQLLYNNDLPEGRAYSRTVRIIIETPREEL